MTQTPDSKPEPSPEALDRVEELVTSAHDGDVDALNELFQRYHQTMVEMARRKLGPRLRLKEDPDDLAQTTFREAARDFHGYRYQGEGSLLRWLIQILQNRSEEHTSELQSRRNLVCRLLLEKKNKNQKNSF